MGEKVRWGILSTAKIGRLKVIPAMQQCTYAEVTAIASRTSEKAGKVAGQLNIPKYYGTYEQLVQDPDIDAIYIPLPNHLHVEWTKKCIAAGKHVLCEKPFALTIEDLSDLIKLRDHHKVKVGEAFMVQTTPQWTRAIEIIRSGTLGPLRSVQGFFSYYLDDPANVRNVPEWGGGGLWDIGCYPVFTSRWAFGEEPKRVFAMMEKDPALNVDRLVSAIMDFPSGQSVFTVGTQLVPHQDMKFFGTEKKLELEIPFNAPPDRPCRMYLDDGDLFGANRKEIEIKTSNQYTVQGDVFSKAIIEDLEVPVPLEKTIQNTAVILALFKSAQTGRWEKPKSFIN